MTHVKRVGAIAALAVSMSVILAAGPVTAANAVTPPPPVIGTGTSGSVLLSPTLAPGESVALTTTGLSAAELLIGEHTTPESSGHSGVTVQNEPEEANIILAGQAWVNSASMVRFETTVSDPSVDLRMDITWIEQGDLNVGGEWSVNTGSVDRFEYRGLYGLWLIEVWQLSGPPGVVFDTTSTVVSTGGAPLTLSPSTVSAASPAVTASWTGLEPKKTYLATIDWGSPQQRSIVEVRTGEPAPQKVATTTTARLSSSVSTGAAPTYLNTRVSTANGTGLKGRLRLRVDGVIRSTTEVSAPSGQVFKLRIPALSPGVHEVKAEFRPAESTVSPSNSPVRRLLVTR